MIIEGLQYHHNTQMKRHFCYGSGSKTIMNFNPQLLLLRTPDLYIRQIGASLEIDKCSTRHRVPVNRVKKLEEVVSLS